MPRRARDKSYRQGLSSSLMMALRPSTMMTPRRTKSLSDPGKPARLFDFISQPRPIWDPPRPPPSSPHPAESVHSASSTPVSMGSTKAAVTIAPITEHPAAVPLPLILKGHSRPSTINSNLGPFHRPKRSSSKSQQQAPISSPLSSSSSTPSPTDDAQQRTRRRSRDALSRHRMSEVQRRAQLRQSFLALQNCLPPESESRVSHCQASILEEAVKLVKGLHEEREALRKEWAALIMMGHAAKRNQI